MDPLDRLCSLSFDKMQINSPENYDKNAARFCGFVTLGNAKELGTHILLVLI